MSASFKSITADGDRHLLVGVREASQLVLPMVSRQLVSIRIFEKGIKAPKKASLLVKRLSGGEAPSVQLL